MKLKDNIRTLCGVEKLSLLLLTTYIVLLPFQIHASVIKIKGLEIQLAEVGLLLLLLGGSSLLLFKKKQLQLCILDLIPGLWLLINLGVNSMVGWNKGLAVETIKVASLCAAYLIVRHLCTKKILRVIPDIFACSSVLMVSIAYVAWIMNLLGHPNQLCWQMKAYPYFGAIGRAHAFTATPNMLASILMLTIILLVSRAYVNREISRPLIILLGYLCGGFVIAVSKTIICLFVAMIIMTIFALQLKARKRLLLIIMGVALSAIYLLGSHYIIANAERDLEANQERGYLAKSSHKIAGVTFVPTAYMVIKSRLVDAVEESFPLGLGTRQFNDYSQRKMNEGTYGTETLAYDPHCTLGGGLAELGIAGFCFLLGIYAFLSKSLIDWIKIKEDEFRLYTITFMTLLVVVTLESGVTDIMNFRHYWVMMAVFAYIFQNRPGQKNHE